MWNIALIQGSEACKGYGDLWFQEGHMQLCLSPIHLRVTESETNEASLWKITLHKRENFHVDTWTFIPTLTRFLYILLCGKCYRLRTGTFYWPKKVNFQELSFLTDISRKFLHSVFFKAFLENNCIPAVRIIDVLPLPAHSGKACKTKGLAILK